MFSQLFFVLLALFSIQFIPENDFSFWIQSPQKAFLWGMSGYLTLLLLLYGQSRIQARAAKSRWQSGWRSFVNLEILFFLTVYHFGLGAQRFFLQGALASYQTPFSLVSLGLYFLALGWSHLGYAYFRFHYSFKKAFKAAWQELLFLCPFCLPFIIATFFLDGLEHLPIWQKENLSMSQDVISVIFSLCFLCLTFIFLPPLLMLCWRCRPLDNVDLQQRLEKMCLSLNFRHAGLKLWSIMPHSFTAGIIGVVSSFRYILFTPALIQHFTPQEIEAILIHEIGHHHHRHLLLYPWILLGMLVTGTLILFEVEQGVFLALGPVLQESDLFAVTMGLFIFYALVLGAYFRLVFGFFSRLFERQADLYIFSSSLSPLYLIQALDRLGVVTGYTHTQPSWHHFSLQERINFLYQAIENQTCIQQHHRRVKKWLMLYFSALFLVSCAYYQVMG